MGDDHQFCLRWNNHQATLISVFDTLLEKGVHVDCTLAAEGQTLKAHKVVLSACSPYFEAVLSQQYDKHPIIILKDVKFAEVRAMMDYMYRGEVNISQEQLGALLKAAESLQIKGLSDSKPPPPPQTTTLPEISPSVPCKIGDIRSISPARDGSREGSASPTRRKRKKRRSSVSPTPLLLNNNPPTPPDSHLDQMAKIKLLTPKDEPHAPTMPIEPPNDSAILEPKSESGGDTRDDATEDLTLDEGAYSDAEHNGPGTSQSLPDISGQGYGWHVDRSQEDVSLSQDGNRDSADVQVDIPVIDLDLEASFLNDSDNGNIPGDMRINPMFSILQQCPQVDSMLPVKSLTSGTVDPEASLDEQFLQNNNFITKPENVEKFIQKCEDEDGEIDDLDDIVLPDESEVFGVHMSDEAVRRSRGRTNCEPQQQFICRHCGKRYRWKSTLRRHESVECGGKPPSHACPYCVYRAKQRGNLGVHIRKHHNAEWITFANTKLRKSKKVDV